MLLSHTHPSIVSRQETFLKKNKVITFKGYSCYHYATEVNDVAHGGLAILVNSSTPHRQLNLQTCLQAVAIRVTCHKTITVCSIYLPPSMVFNTSDFITARRYASAVLAVVVCPSVCLSVRLSVCHKPVLYRNGNT